MSEASGGVRRLLDRLRRHGPDAPDPFSAFMKDHLAPELRLLGMTGSGQVFRLPAPGWFALLGLQRSSGNTASRIRFTANVTVVAVAEWEAARANRPHLPNRPAASTFYGAGVWQRRVGSLVPGGQDVWWELTPTTSRRRLALEVVACVRSYVLPAVQARIDGGTSVPAD